MKDAADCTCGMVFAVGPSTEGRGFFRGPAASHFDPWRNLQSRPN